MKFRHKTKSFSRFLVANNSPTHQSAGELWGKYEQVFPMSDDFLLSKKVFSLFRWASGRYRYTFGYVFV